MHISLDSALGRQRRLNSVGESVLQIAPNAAAAYSLRSLTGGDPKVVRVRRDTDGGAGDNDEQDFTASEVSSGALVDFVGSGNDGFVETWYDQSGEGNDAVQQTKGSQPKIVINGSLISNGLDFDGSGDFLDLPDSIISNINSASIFAVAENEASGFTSTQGITVSTGSSSFVLPKHFLNSLSFGYSNTSIALGSTDTNTHLFTAIAGSSNVEAFVDGTSKGTLSSASGFSQPGTGGIGGENTGTWNGQFQEIIIYASDQSSNRVAIETNIQAAYPYLP